MSYLIFDLNYLTHRTLSMCDRILKDRKSFSNPNFDDAKLFSWKFCTDLFFAIRKFEASKVLLCQDSRSWRKSHSDSYKASRTSGGRDFAKIFEIISIIVKALESKNVEHLQVLGLEADDLCRLSAVKISKVFNDDIIIYSGDKDFFQMPKDNILYYHSPTDTLYRDEKTVGRSESSLSPILVALEKIVFGDDSDEVEGIPTARTYRKKITGLLIEFSKKFSNIDDLTDILSKHPESLASIVCTFAKVPESDVIPKILSNMLLVVQSDLMLPSNLKDDFDKIELKMKDISGDFKNARSFSESLF